MSYSWLVYFLMNFELWSFSLLLDTNTVADYEYLVDSLLSILNACVDGKIVYFHFYMCGSYCFVCIYLISPSI